MNSRFFNIFFSYSIYALTVLLLFLLVFERFLEFPLFVSWLGHWHPLILHFPIVLVLVTVIQYWRKDPYLSWYLAATTLLTLISAITGFVLSMEGGSKGNLILTHQWMGVAVSLIMVFWHFFSKSISSGQIKLLQGTLVLLVVLTGHFGGMVTHGQDFLAFGSKYESEILSMPENPNIYAHVVQPVLNKKCVSCHNENKAKGGLILTDFSSIFKGGKSGSILGEEGLFHRINLPMGDEDHMPPADEKQLDKDEFTILKTWLDQGASAELMFSDLVDGSDLNIIVSQLIGERKSNLWEDLPEISDDEILKYASDYCTIQRMYNGSNALQVIVFPHKTFESKELQQLKPIAKNTVDLNLSNLPLTEKDIDFFNSFENLEKLNLSGSGISDEGFLALEKLDRLQILKIYNTKMSDASLKQLSEMPALSNLYIYNTNISEDGIQALIDDNPALTVVAHAPKALEFKSLLPAPILDPVNYFFRQPFYVKLNHPLNSIDIRYTLNDTDPDENASIIRDSLLVDRNFTLKYYASKEGWESSPVDSVQFLMSEHEPFSYELTYAPDQKYLGIGKSLLFDLEKGSTNFGDDAWMAFKDNPFTLTCEFKKETPLSEVILSSMVNTDPYLFPPSGIKVYGGSDSANLSLLGSLSPREPRERIERHFEFYRIEFEATPIRFVKIEVIPLKRIPMWHQGKGERGWFFIDEVIFVAE